MTVEKYDIYYVNIYLFKESYGKFYEKFVTLIYFAKMQWKM